MFLNQLLQILPYLLHCILKGQAVHEKFDNLPQELCKRPLTYLLTPSLDLCLPYPPDTFQSGRAYNFSARWLEAMFPVSLFAGCMKFKFVICKDEYLQRLGTRQGRGGQSITHLSHSIVLHHCTIAPLHQTTLHTVFHHCTRVLVSVLHQKSASPRHQYILAPVDKSILHNCTILISCTRLPAPA